MYKTYKNLSNSTVDAYIYFRTHKILPEDKDGMSVLIIAVLKKDYRLLDIAFEYQSPKYRNSRGETLLMYANNREMKEYLIYKLNNELQSIKKSLI